MAQAAVFTLHLGNTPCLMPRSITRRYASSYRSRFLITFRSNGERSEIGVRSGTGKFFEDGSYVKRDHGAELLVRVLLGFCDRRSLIDEPPEGLLLTEEQKILLGREVVI